MSNGAGSWYTRARGTGSEIDSALTEAQMELRYQLVLYSKAAAFPNCFGCIIWHLDRRLVIVLVCSLARWMFVGDHLR